MVSPNGLLEPEQAAPRSELHTGLDSIDKTVIRYHRDLLTDNLITEAERHRLVVRIEEGDTDASHQLGNRYAGLVAVVAYDFKDSGIESDGLLEIGFEALRDTAMSFTSNGVLFEDHAIVAVKTALSTSTGINHPLKPSQRPMQDFYHHVPRIKADIERQAANQKVLERFKPIEQRVLPLLHLPTRDIIAALEISREVFWHTIASAKSKVPGSTPNIMSLALELQGMGLEYDLVVPEKPLVEIFTNEEMKLGNLLGLPAYNDIAEKMGSDYDAGAIKIKVAYMRRRLNARSGREVALIINRFDTGERRDTNADPRKQELAVMLGRESLEGCELEVLMASAKPLERQAVEEYYIKGTLESWRQVGEHAGVSESCAFRRGKRGVQAMIAALEAEK